MKSLSPLNGLAGLLALVAVACLMLGWVAAAAECPGKPEDWPRSCSLMKFFFDWQQLLGSFVAIVAAGIGWLAVNRQVVQAEHQELERQRRSHAASRAVLPLALSGVSEYCADCVDALLQLYQRPQEELVRPKNHLAWKEPSTPTAAIMELKAMVETSPPYVAEAIAALLRTIQLLAARIGSVRRAFDSNSTSVMRVNVEQFLVHAIEVQGRANSLFDYSRERSNHVSSDELSREQMFNAALGLKLFPGQYPKVDERIERDYHNA